MIAGIIHSLRQLRTPNDAWSWLASALRGTRGLIVVRHNRASPPRPEAPLELYEFEACPFCRKVRDVMSELDLAYISRTCPKGDETKRARARALGGKTMFPFLVDPNTDTALYESEDIITYLMTQYGPGRGLPNKLLAPVNTTSSLLASMARPRGGRVRPGLARRTQPDDLLVVYNFEASPYCRKVREALNTLNLDYEVRSVAKGSRRRPELVERGGRMQVPYLIDPNTDTALYESDAIVAYLHATYADAA